MIPGQKSGASAHASVPVFQTDLVPESDVLIVSFSGLFGVFIPFDFFMTTKMLSYNRILVRDPYQLFYLRGVDENGFDHLLERLRAEIARIKARTVIFIGASAGGFASILFGHLLGADYIHAFAPRTHLKLTEMARELDYKSLINRFPMVMKLNYRLSSQHRRFLDLKPLVAASEGKPIRTNLHACAYCPDAARVKYLKGCPNTKIFLYPCNDHNVAKLLVQSKCLHTMLLKQNLDTPEQAYREFYGDFDPAKSRHHKKMV
jgi:hypothetical protein